MQWYCLVNELKPEHVEDYANIHRTAHRTEWKTQLDALRKAGAQNCIVYIHGNESILFYQCEDIDESFAGLGEDDDNNKWQAHIASWIAGKPKFDGSEKAKQLEKVFDLSEQLDGFLQR
jgi:L-rhamnose mutarotase